MQHQVFGSRGPTKISSRRRRIEPFGTNTAPRWHRAFQGQGKNLIKNQNHEEIEMTSCTRNPVLGGNLFAALNQCPGSTFIDEPSVHKALERMVIRIEDNMQVRQDLFQEAMVHFWSSEQEHPGQRIRWYLQGVKFRLQHLRASGRSLDSSKRRGAQAAARDHRDRPHESADPLESGDGTMSEINDLDIRSLLNGRLVPIDQIILVALEEGWSSREVAQRLQISHESVRRHRNKIAAAALKLGIVPRM